MRAEFNDPHPPTAEEIRSWAANPDSVEPIQDCDIIVQWQACSDLVLELAADAACPNQAYFLHILYFIVGSAVRSHDRPGDPHGCACLARDGRPCTVEALPACSPSA